MAKHYRRANQEEGVAIYQTAEQIKAQEPTMPPFALLVSDTKKHRANGPARRRESQDRGTITVTVGSQWLADHPTDQPEYMAQQQWETARLSASVNGLRDPLFWAGMAIYLFGAASIFTAVLLIVPLSRAGIGWLLPGLGRPLLRIWQSDLGMLNGGLIAILFGCFVMNLVTALARVTANQQAARWGFTQPERNRRWWDRLIRRLGRWLTHVPQ